MAKTTAAKVVSTIFTMALAQLQKAPAAVKALVQQVNEALPGLLSLSPKDRLTSHGKLKKGQLEAIVAVFDTLGQFPAYFTSLKLDSDQLHDLSARLPILIAVRKALAPLNQRLADSILEMANELAIPAEKIYHLARPQADSDNDLRDTLEDAITFYGDIAKKSAQTKAKEKKATTK